LENAALFTIWGKRVEIVVFDLQTRDEIKGTPKMTKERRGRVGILMIKKVAMYRYKCVYFGFG